MIVGITLLYFGFNFLKGIDFFSTSNKYFVIYQKTRQGIVALPFQKCWTLLEIESLNVQPPSNRLLGLWWIKI